MISARPSGSVVIVGYQRAWCISTTRVQLLVAGLKILVSLIPTPSLTYPPATNSLPSASSTWPEQKIEEKRLVTPMKVWLLGFQSRAATFGLSSQASHITISPEGS